VAQPRTILISRTPPAPAIAPEAAASSLPEAYKAACLGCHDEHMMLQQRLTRAQWEREVAKMTGWGAVVKPADQNGVLDYLSSRFKP